MQFNEASYKNLWGMGEVSLYKKTIESSTLPSYPHDQKDIIKKEDIKQTFQMSMNRTFTLRNSECNPSIKGNEYILCKIKISHN